MDRFKIRMAEVSCSDNISFNYCVILQIDSTWQKTSQFFKRSSFWAKHWYTMNTTKTITITTFTTTTTSITTTTRLFSLGVKLMWPFVHSVWKGKHNRFINVWITCAISPKRIHTQQIYSWKYNPKNYDDVCIFIHIFD